MEYLAQPEKQGFKWKHLLLHRETAAIKLLKPEFMHDFLSNLNVLHS